jgi:pyrophosphatase PpaX
VKGERVGLADIQATSGGKAVPGIKTVLFDLDGTLIDTNELIIQSFLHTLEGLTDQPLTRERLIPEMGGLLEDQLKGFSGREQVADLVDRYREFNLSKHDELVREFPHVREVLDRLKERGLQLGIVTSKMRPTAEQGMRLCGLDGLMDTVVSAEDVERHKPHPDPILLALRRLGAAAETTIMLGDTHYDILSARAAGVVSVGVAWSLKGADFLRGFEPDFIIEDMRELLGLAGER